MAERMSPSKVSPQVTPFNRNHLHQRHARRNRNKDVQYQVFCKTDDLFKDAHD
jgi:hypothetical protein